MLLISFLKVTIPFSQEGSTALAVRLCVPPDAFRDLLSGFRDGVLVNAVSGVCYPDRFIDVVKSSDQKDRYRTVACYSPGNRTRNSRFSHAFVQSLARVSLPGVTRRCIAWGIQDYEAFMREQLMRNLDLTPGNLAVVSEEFIDGMTVVEDLIFRDKVDIAYDPRVSPRRRRIEWPTADTNIQSHLSATNVGSSSSPTSTKSIINNELAKCDVKGGLRADFGSIRRTIRQETKLQPHHAQSVLACP